MTVDVVRDLTRVMEALSPEQRHTLDESRIRNGNVEVRRQSR
jgi:hypothetical protein